MARVGWRGHDAQGTVSRSHDDDDIVLENEII